MIEAPTSHRMLAGVVLGTATSLLVVLLVGAAMRGPAYRLVPEDASGRLQRVAIHYVPAMDTRALPVWTTLFRVLPVDVAVEVAVTRRSDFDRLVAKLADAGVGYLERFRPVVVDRPLTTWSRDRMASLSSGERGGVLAPPRVGVATGGRAGDWEAPFAISREVYRAEPRIAELVFEGGDLAASRTHVFGDANLIERNLGRGDASRATLEETLRRTFDQEIVWLGDAPGDVPEHHIMMYMVPIGDRAAIVGDVRLGLPFASGLDIDQDTDELAAQFDRAAQLLVDRGFAVTRMPVIVLRGARSYLTYTNALFDRDVFGPVVYLPTYRHPALDTEAARIYGRLGFRVVPVDVSTIYQLNGSLGCLVNVMARE